jgi:hypothetical protein
MLPADDLHGMVFVEVGRKFRDKIAETAPLFRVLDHFRIRGRIRYEFAICPIVALLVRIERNIGRAQWN